MTKTKKKPAAPQRRAGTTAGERVQRISLPTRGADGTVRIVSGRYKRTPLSVGSRDGLRPTPLAYGKRFRLAAASSWRFFQRVFSGYVRRQRCTGLEAASNGAARVVMLEKDRKTASAISLVISKLQAQDVAQCFAADAFVWLKAVRRSVRCDFH